MQGVETMNLSAGKSVMRNVRNVLEGLLVVVVLALLFLGVLHLKFYQTEMERGFEERDRAIEASLTAMTGGPMVLSDQTLVRVVLKDGDGNVQYYTHWDNIKKREVRDKPMVETMTLARAIEYHSEAQANRKLRIAFDSYMDRIDNGIADKRDMRIVDHEMSDAYQHDDLEGYYYGIFKYQDFKRP